MSSVEFSCAMAMRRAVDPAKKAWKYIKELNDAAGTDMDAVAIRTGSGDYPLSCCPDESSDEEFILHTSGTTKGTGKPVVISDRAVNLAVAGFFKVEGLTAMMEDPVSGLSIDPSNAYGMVDQIHMPLAVGGVIGLVPGASLNPDFYKSIETFRLTCLFSNKDLLDRIVSLPDVENSDFSSLRCVILGGSYVSSKDKYRYDAFFKAHGAEEVVILNGYGLSELCGACCLSTTSLDDESIGYTLPGVRARLYDEDKDIFYSLEDAPCEGVLYLNADFMASSYLNGRKIFETETADGGDYICTQDFVRADPDGRLVFLGRANRYFVNEVGVRYESGRVETEVSRQSGIEGCGVIPVYKSIA